MYNFICKLKLSSQARNKNEAWTLPCLLPASSWFLDWLILWLWTWRQHVPLKHQCIFSGLHGIIFRKINLSSSLSLPIKILNLFLVSPCYLLHLVFLKLITLAVVTINITLQTINIKMDVIWIELAESSEKLMARMISYQGKAV